MQASGENVEVWSAAPQSGYANELERTLTVKYLGDGSVSSSLFPLMRELRTRAPTTLISASFHANCIALLASIFTRTPTKYAIADHPSVDAALQELSLLKRILWRILILLLYPLADKHIAVSKGVAKAMSKYGGINTSRIAVIPNPVISDEIFDLGSIGYSTHFLTSKNRSFFTLADCHMKKISLILSMHLKRFRIRSHHNSSLSAMALTD